MQLSICILAHNQPLGVGRLLRSIGGELEVVIGDNSSEEECTSVLRGLSHVYRRVEDEELWRDGFGPTKQTLIDLASNDFVLIADTDEEWGVHFGAADLLHAGSLMRTRMLVEDAWVEHGRVFDRRSYRLLGLVHEAPYDRWSRKHWSECPFDGYFATITHHDSSTGEAYRKRKTSLYDNLIYRAYTRPELRTGIDRWWFDVHMKRLLQTGWMPSSYEEWKEGCHER